MANIISKIKLLGVTYLLKDSTAVHLEENGKISADYLPSYVDDVIEGYLYNGIFYENSAHTIQITGETGKIYTDIATSRTYRWSGSVYSALNDVTVEWGSFSDLV